MTSEMVFFNQAPMATLKSALKTLLTKCNPDCKIYVSRYREPWASWQRIYIDGDEDYSNETQDIEYERKLIDEIPDLFLPDGFFSVTPYCHPWGLKIHDAVRNQIDSGIRNTFAPSECVLCFGYHDIIEESDPEAVTLLGRAHFSCSFWGYGSPSDSLEFERQLFQLPEVIEIQHEIEAIAGPLDRCFYYVG